MDAAAQMMFTSVRMEGYNAAETMHLVQEVRAWGLMQGEDFDFAYHPPLYHERNPGYDRASFAEFRFYEERYATMFKLKYL